MTSTFYPPFHIGGDANHVKYLAEELVKLGHEVHVFYNRDAYVVKRRHSLPVLESQNGVLVHEFESPLNLSPYGAYLFGDSLPINKAFRALVSQIEPQIVHHHNVSLLGYGIISKYGSYANIYTAHDYWLICPQNNLLRNGVQECDCNACFSCAIRRMRTPQIWRYCNSFENAISSIDLVIAPSTYLQRKLSQELNIRSVMIENFAPLPPSHIPEQRYSNYFLFVGALEKHKGIMNLLEVFRRSRDRIGAKLLIAGDGSLKSSIVQFIQQHSLSNSVVLLGSLSKEELYPLYLSANALIVPSICPENSPLVIMEAFSVGTPVIVSNKGGLPEIINKLNMHLVFDNFSQLEEILVNFSKKDFPQSEIQHIFEQNFSPHAYVKRYIEALNMLPTLSA